MVGRQQREARVKVAFIVDDHKLIADTLAEILRDHGYDAEAFYSGVVAIRAARSTTPDVLITDFCMPEMDGLTLASHIVDQNDDCKVVLMSGDVAATRTHPARDKYPVLEKPVSIATLMQLLDAEDVVSGEKKRPAA